MANRLSHCDFDACSRALRELYASPLLQGFPDRLLPLLAELVPASHIAYNAFNEQQRRFDIHYLPEPPGAQKLLPQFAAHIHTHPLHEHYPEMELVPMKISDVATLRQFRQTPIYQEYYRPLDTRYQMICFF